jgi:phospholipase D1/2
VQLFRSIDKYSINIKITQKSILSAYVNAIRTAEHFIYIENQYFLGSCGYWPDHIKAGCKHPIPYELAMKICEKIRQKKPFCVYIVTPLYPEGIPKSDAVQEFLHWQFLTQSFMYKMVFNTIQEVYLDQPVKPVVTDYLNFYCLGNRETLNGSDAKVVNANDFANHTENDIILNKTRRFQIYVHSKMMIVDDAYIIVGSANINERSMAGDRDTEIAMGAYQPNYLTSYVIFKKNYFFFYFFFSFSFFLLFILSSFFFLSLSPKPFTKPNNNKIITK